VDTSPNRRAPRWPLLVVMLLFILMVAVVTLDFLTANESMNSDALTPVTELTVDTYADIVTPLLENADPEKGALLVEEYSCVACHRLGVAAGIAPSFEGGADRAATRRPPLTAAAYIYESIVHPEVYVVEGYQPAMPQDYSDRLSDSELGDIIVYLLMPTAQ
jgi:hypothetical protein